MRPSMGSVGDAYDNAMCESFFATLECELLARHRFRTPKAGTIRDGVTSGPAPFCVRWRAAPARPAALGLHAEAASILVTWCGAGRALARHGPQPIARSSARCNV